MKKVAAVLIICLGLVSGMLAAYILFSKPDELTAAEKEKAINEILGRKANLDSKVVVGDTSFKGKYAYFDYPKAAKIYDYRDPGVENNGSSLESFSFDLQAPRRVFNYTADTSTANSVEDIPAASFRKNASSGYTEEKVNADGKEGLAYMKNANGEFPAEKTAFFLVNGKIYTISVTAGNLDDAKKLFTEVIGSFTFLD